MKKIDEAKDQVMRSLLLMKYDTSKTLTENETKIKEIVAEQDISLSRAAKAAVTGAAMGATIGGPPGALVGATLGVFATWLNSGRSTEAKKSFEACKTDNSTPTLNRNTLRSIADSLNTAIEGAGTDEDAIKNALSQIPTLADLCGVIKQYEFHGDLWTDLDGDLETDSEWKNYVLAPLRPAFDATQDAIDKMKNQSQNQSTSDSIEGWDGSQKSCKVICKVDAQIVDESGNKTGVCKAGTKPGTFFGGYGNLKGTTLNNFARVFKNDNSVMLIYKTGLKCGASVGGGGNNSGGGPSWCKGLASTGFKTAEEGNKFREWVNTNYPDYAKEIKLDKAGKPDNCYIRKAWAEKGSGYTTTGGGGATEENPLEGGEYVGSGPESAEE